MRLPMKRPINSIAPISSTAQNLDQSIVGARDKPSNTSKYGASLYSGQNVRSSSPKVEENPAKKVKVANLTPCSSDAADVPNTVEKEVEPAVATKVTGDNEVIEKVPECNAMDEAEN